MFLSTLGLGEWSVLSWVKRASSGMHLMGNPAERRSMRMEVKVPTEPTLSRKTLRQFLQSLPKMESHYFRSSTTKLYLEPIWYSMAQLHNSYKTNCIAAGLVPCCIKTFRYEFNELNMSLFSPKKDQCDVCCSYKVGNLEEQDYEKHCLNPYSPIVHNCAHVVYDVTRTVIPV